MTLQSFEDAYSAPLPPSQANSSRRGLKAESSIESSRYISGDEVGWSDEEYVVMKQRIAYLCIAVSTLQLAILMIQLVLCGVASVDVNPLIGPFPDAYSEWGGKNVYLMVEDHQYFRIILRYQATNL